MPVRTIGQKGATGAGDHRGRGKIGRNRHPRPIPGTEQASTTAGTTRITDFGRSHAPGRQHRPDNTGPTARDRQNRSGSMAIDDGGDRYRDALAERAGRLSSSNLELVLAGIGVVLGRS